MSGRPSVRVVHTMASGSGWASKIEVAMLAIKVGSGCGVDQRMCRGVTLAERRDGRGPIPERGDDNNSFKEPCCVQEDVEQNPRTQIFAAGFIIVSFVQSLALETTTEKLLIVPLPSSSRVVASACHSSRGRVET